jgi:hypothetical protein
MLNCRFYIGQEPAGQAAPQSQSHLPRQRGQPQQMRQAEAAHPAAPQMQASPENNVCAIVLKRTVAAIIIFGIWVGCEVQAITETMRAHPASCRVAFIAQVGALAPHP